jgi:hypothetical protein
VRIIAESPAEADLLHRRLRALRHLLGPEVQITTVGLAAEALGPALDRLELEMRWRRQG